MTERVGERSESLGAMCRGDLRHSGQSARPFGSLTKSREAWQEGPRQGPEDARTQSQVGAEN